MDTYYLLYIGCCVLSFLAGMVFIPAVLRYCEKYELYDAPGARKVHKCNIPRLGGVVFLPGMLLSFLIMVVTFYFTSGGQQENLSVSLWSVMFFVGLFIVYATGLVDDIAELKASTKFLAQIAAASIMPAAGLYFNSLYGFCGIYDIPFWIGAPLTVLTICFINNAINLIDGIDGLSSSLSILALAGFLILFHQNGMNLYCMLIAGLIGVLLSFIPYNVFGKAEKGKKIFMGDSGSLTIGFILGFLVVKYSCNTPLLEYNENRLVIAMSLILVPVLDVFRVMLVRMQHRIPIFTPDKRHIHHKLLRAGYNQHQALGFIIALAAVFIGINLLMLHLNVRNELTLVLDLVVWVAFHAWLNKLIAKNEK